MGGHRPAWRRWRHHACDVASLLGRLLDNADGSDVAFSVLAGALLAPRSPVLKAELLGSMAEATMPTTTLRDIELNTFSFWP